MKATMMRNHLLAYTTALPDQEGFFALRLSLI